MADVPVGTARYFYGHGKWYEVGARFLETLEDELRELLGKSSSVRLPTWPKGVANDKGRDSHDEDWYKKQAAGQDGYLLFDKKNIVTEKFNGGGLEVCDVLGPDNQLICVKKATGSNGTAPLNHLFAQAVTAVETLRSDEAIRSAFLKQVADRNPSHRLLSDFGTLKVVLAILLKDGKEINVDSLFAFAQVSLLQSARRLRAMNAEVEVVAIRR
ncbi:TIGR04141 family sporadically distributed protein [Streptomyces durbertensis]|uniref:TIGR04141 family sporadically distributed protein n=1 Tax=Streptomyces durbertensis TaxID=2448886 RepID=A0ABR6EAN1_9ACTN|nr:TIGR04141 family sporadically distributed protein [Streptomyces durbertensis]